MPFGQHGGNGAKQALGHHAVQCQIPNQGPRRGDGLSTRAGLELGGLTSHELGEDGRRQLGPDHFPISKHLLEQAARVAYVAVPSGGSTPGDMVQVMRQIQQPMLNTGQRIRIAPDSNDPLLSQYVQEMPQANRLVGTWARDSR